MTLRTVLMLGHSTFSDPGESGQSLTEVTAAELRSRAPEEAWECQAELLYMAPNMGERTASLVARLTPDFVVLMPGEMGFTRDYVVYRVRERWPRLYHGSVAVAGLLLRIGGGGPDGTPTPRGWLFRGPRWLAAKLIGVAPAARVEQAVELTRATIDAVLRHEGTQPVFIFANRSLPSTSSPEETRRRREFYVSRISAFCREKHVAQVHPAEIAALYGRTFRLGPDAWHEDEASKQMLGSMIAQAILRTLAGTEELELTLTV